MVSEVVSTAQQVLAVPGDPAKNGSTPRQEIKMFGEDGFSFWDFLDVINPLQHIPVVSTLYRSLTGDEIDPGARILGGTLFGGPIGAALSTANVMVEHSSGKDLGEHVVAFFTGEETGAPVQVASVTETRRPLDNQTAAPERRAETGSISQEIGFARAQDRNSRNTISKETAAFDTAGMAAIPVARQSPYALADGTTAIDSFYRANTARYRPAARPDLEALSPERTTSPALLEGASSGAAMNDEMPTDSISAAPASAPVNRPPSGGSTETPVEIENGWIFNAMMRALDKYETTARLQTDGENSSVSTIR